MHSLEATISLAGVVCLLAGSSCALRSPAHSFRVLAATPSYLLRSPDTTEIPFPEILRSYNGYERGRDWVDLRPGMELRIENAYYRAGMSRRGLAGYLGTEIARYEVRSGGGLQLLAIQSMKDRPAEQPPVEQLIRPFAMGSACYRFYYEILFRKSAEARGSVLIGANTKEDLDRLASDLLRDADAVCGAGSRNCTVFPEACSVSIEMEIVVNDKPRNVIWGSLLLHVVDHPRHLALFRMYHGRLLRVTLNAHDVEALRLPLLPGDHIRFS